MRLTKLKRDILGVLSEQTKAISANEVWEILGKHGRKHNVERALLTMTKHNAVRRFKSNSDTGSRWCWLYAHPDRLSVLYKFSGEMLKPDECDTLRRNLDCEYYIKGLNQPAVLEFFRKDPEMFYYMCEFIIATRDEEVEL